MVVTSKRLIYVAEIASVAVSVLLPCVKVCEEFDTVPTIGTPEYNEIFEDHVTLDARLILPVEPFPRVRLGV